MFSYKKKDNSVLFNNFENSELTNITNPQNYNPIYNNFFSLNETNFNSINLDHHFSLYSINTTESNNKFKATVTDCDMKKHNKDIFIKYCPLLDPVKYMIGKYEIYNNELFSLPTFTNINNINEKMNDPNNHAYVDGFFSYLTSKLLHQHNFIHGLDFYGSFLGIKNNFEVNIFDETEYMLDSTFFQKHNNVLFNVDTDLINNSNSYTRNHKKKLYFIDNNDTDNNGNNDKIILELSDIKDISHLDSIFSLSSYSQNTLSSNINGELIYEQSKNMSDEQSKNMSRDSGSTCSSRSSTTNSENSNGENSDGENSDGEKSDNENSNSENSNSENSDGENDELFATINKFPVHAIALEQCENTLDSLMMNEELNPHEWDSIIIQLLMSLITFQEKFNLTHNDLHTNNVMYNKTHLEYLYYKLDGKYYKVPTYGRIFKIIDFGRAIYKFRGKLICSDSFHKKGDAATQYNCEPYFNDKKPRLEPNYSFDLCRLGCSLFDYIMDEEDCDDENSDNIKTPIFKIIANWCKDDKGRNIMYKSNGEERYPDFKLYKMIARTVHNHVPSKVLEHPYFDKYIVNKKKIKNNNKSTHVMDINEIPSFIKCE